MNEVASLWTTKEAWISTLNENVTEKKINKRKVTHDQTRKQGIQIWFFDSLI